MNELVSKKRLHWRIEEPSYQSWVGYDSIRFFNSNSLHLIQHERKSSLSYTMMLLNDWLFLANYNDTYLIWSPSR